MRLLLIRHGQTPANVDGILATAHPGPGLTPLGRRQAEALPEALSGEAISAIYVSTLVRTHLTAAPLAQRLGLTPVETAGLHEIEAGDLEGRADLAAVRGYQGTLKAWGDGDLSHAMPGGPDGVAFFERFDGAIQRIAAAHPEETVAIVSHGAAIRVWCGGVPGNVDPAFAIAHELDNTGIVAVSGSPETGWLLESWMGEPIGGAAVEDDGGPDPTGDPIRSAHSA